MKPDVLGVYNDTYCICHCVSPLGVGRYCTKEQCPCGAPEHLDLCIQLIAGTLRHPIVNTITLYCLGHNRCDLKNPFSRGTMTNAFDCSPKP